MEGGTYVCPVILGIVKTVILSSPWRFNAAHAVNDNLTPCTSGKSHGRSTRAISPTRSTSARSL